MEESNDNATQTSCAYSHAYSDDGDDKGAKNAGRTRRESEGTTRFQIPNENQNVTHGHTKMQLFVEDPARIKKLATKLDRKFDLIISQENEKSRDRGQHVQESIFQDRIWGLPSNLITFLASAIESDASTKYLKLQSWPIFKKEIFEIIDHRIENASEINGVVNTSYMSLDEHLIIFMVHKFDNA